MGFWRGKRVLITGHTGFKGGWLTLWLNHLQAELSGISLQAHGISLFNVAELEEEVSSYYCDITNFPELVGTVQKIQPEIIFHLAAQALVRPSYDDPVSSFNTNIMGTAHLLEAVQQCASVKAVVVVTSDKCYENKEWVWGYRENDRLGGKDPYSCSKACAELVVNSYRNSFLAKQDKNIATARAGNVVGGGDWGQDRLLPDLLAAFSQQKLITIRYPNAIRPWQHVCEPLSGYLGLARKLFEGGSSFAQGWNFGPHDSANKTVSWIADYLQQKWPESLPWCHSQEEHLPESQVLKLDNSAAGGALDWHPILSVEEALDWTVNWYQAWQEKRNMKQFTSNQIQDFIKLMGEGNGK